MLRSRRTGAFVINPYVSFKDFGGYIGHYPYREVKLGTTPATLGRTIIRLLKLSGPTGLKTEEGRLYTKKHHDAESKRIGRKYFPKPSVVTTSWVAKRFLRAQVSTRDGQKSWLIETYEYDSSLRADAAVGKGTRVKISAGRGPSDLGEALLSKMPV